MCIKFQPFLVETHRPLILLILLISDAFLGRNTIHPLQTLLLLQIFQLLFPRQNFASFDLSGFQMWGDLLLKQEA